MQRFKLFCAGCAGHCAGRCAGQNHYTARLVQTVHSKYAPVHAGIKTLLFLRANFPRAFTSTLHTLHTLHKSVVSMVCFVRSKFFALHSLHKNKKDVFAGEGS